MEWECGLLIRNLGHSHIEIEMCVNPTRRWWFAESMIAVLCKNAPEGPWEAKQLPGVVRHPWNRVTVG